MSEFIIVSVQKAIKIGDSDALYLHIATITKIIAAYSHNFLVYYYNMLFLCTQEATYCNFKQENIMKVKRRWIVLMTAITDAGGGI